MAKDTAETASQLSPGAAELAAFEAAKAEYQALNKAYQSDPSKQALGGTSNEEYIALKQAGDAKEAAESAYYRALRGTADDPFRFNPRNNPETGYFTDAEGNFGLGILPENYYYNDYSGTAVEGVPGWAGSPADGLSLGGPGQAPATAGQDGQDPFSPPPNYQPSGGSGLPNGGIPLGYKGWTGQQPRQGVDYGGVGVGGTTPNMPAGGLEGLINSMRPDLTGYESSSNKDFYQKQFQDMRTQQNGQRFNELGAAIRAQEAANAPQGQAFGGDPWSWTNLPDVKTGTGQAEVTPVSWSLNDNYGITSDMTNKQAVGSLGQLFGAEDMARLNAHFAGNPDTANNNNWLTSNPQALSAQFASNANPNNPVSPEWTDTMSKVFNNLYLKSGGTTGISTPEGYALPVNVGE